MTIKSIIGAAAVATMVAGSASAATIYATSATGLNLNSGLQETCTVASRSTDRSDLCNGLGAPDVDGSFSAGGFVGVGLFESITFGFGQSFTAPATVWEVTANAATNNTWLETVTIELLNSSNPLASVIGTLQNLGNPTDGVDRFRVVFNAGAGDIFDSIRFVSVEPTQQPDGFDIDAVAVSAVPLPAGALLLLGGLGGLAALRRRKG